MNTKTYYRPSVLARTAKILIPILQNTLPKSLYKQTYDVLYRSYQLVSNQLYNFHVISASLLGDKNKILKTRLTKKMLPYTMGGRKALENAFDIVLKIEQNNIPGALVECGVAEGGTAGMLALANMKLGNKIRDKWFFDSFEGLPEPTEEDYINGKAGEFIRPLPKGSCLGTLEQVSNLMFNTLNLDRKNVYLIKGWFQDTLYANKDKVGDAIAILRLDGDWYESTKIPLEVFYDNVSNGGVVIIDDYGTCFGARKAVDEFRDSRNIDSPLIPDGRGGIWFEKN